MKYDSIIYFSLGSIVGSLLMMSISITHIAKTLDKIEQHQAIIASPPEK